METKNNDYNLPKASFSTDELALMRNILSLHESIAYGKERLNPDSYKPEFISTVIEARKNFLKDFNEKLYMAQFEFYSIFQRKEDK